MVLMIWAGTPPTTVFGGDIADDDSSGCDDGAVSDSDAGKNGGTAPIHTFLPMTIGFGTIAALFSGFRS